MAGHGLLSVTSEAEQPLHEDNLMTSKKMSFHAFQWKTKGQSVATPCVFCAFKLEPK